MGSINDEIQRALVPIYGNKSTNHLLRLFRIDHGLLEENLWQNFLQNLGYTGSINDQLYYLFSNFESIFNASTGLYLPGTSGNNLTTPDHADLDITEELCAIIELTPADWTPSTDQFVIGKWLGSGDQRSWSLLLKTTGILSLQMTTDGTAGTVLTRNSTVVDTNATKLALSVIVNTTSSTAVIYLWEFVIDSWNLLSSSDAFSMSSMFSSTSNLIIGSYPDGSSSFIGTIYSAQIYDGVGDNSAPGLGTLVAEFDASAPVGPRYRDRTGKIWTINGSAWSWV